jgi:fumarate reductase subunit C
MGIIYYAFMYGVAICKFVVICSIFVARFVVYMGAVLWCMQSILMASGSFLGFLFNPIGIMDS